MISVTLIRLPLASPTVRGQVTYLLPVVAIVLGVLALGETTAESALAGIALVLASGRACWSGPRRPGQPWPLARVTTGGEPSR
jgi:drug/metabolite transporter (DMT)-like permease